MEKITSQRNITFWQYLVGTIKAISDQDRRYHSEKGKGLALIIGWRYKGHSVGGRSDSLRAETTKKQGLRKLFTFSAFPNGQIKHS